MKRVTVVSLDHLAKSAGVGISTAARWVHGRDVRRGSARLLEGACKTLGLRVEEVRGVDQIPGSEGEKGS